MDPPSVQSHHCEHWRTREDPASARSSITGQGGLTAGGGLEGQQDCQHPHCPASLVAVLASLEGQQDCQHPHCPASLVVVLASRGRYLISRPGVAKAAVLGDYSH